MTTTDIDTRKYPLSTVIGVFLDYEQANRAIDELRHANFSYERIRIVKRGTGRFVDTLKSLFSGQATMASSTSSDLIQMGMPEYEAHYYQYELDSDHVLVIMNAEDRPEAAFSIMRQNGAFDINSRLKVNATESSLEADQHDGSEPTPGPNRQPVASVPSGQPSEADSDRVSARRPAEEAQTTDTSVSPMQDTPPVSSDPDAVVEQDDRQTSDNA